MKEMARPVLCIMPDGSRHVAGPPLTRIEWARAFVAALFIGALMVGVLLALGAVG